MSRLEPQKRGAQDQRVVKLLLPLRLIRAMDRLLVDGAGGYTTRNEFVGEAIDSYILELTHEPAPPEPAALARPGRGRLAVAPTLLDPDQPELFDGQSAGGEFARPLSLEATALAPVPAGLAVFAGGANVIEEPLFGMHNRDYPSLWAARRLANQYEAAGPLGFDEFAERATEEAWEFGEAIRPLESSLGQKLTALFPTNHEKRQTASSAFRVFAIGSVTATGDQIQAAGPLFLWRVLGVEERDGAVLVGLTATGLKLLDQLAGLTVAPPHPADKARIFMTHLREHAPADWWGFEHTLSVVAERPTRTELVEAFRAARSDWRESVAATNAQGYVARAREWGLIAPKVVDRCYELTRLGAELAEGAAK